jgi:hypothetical protein
VNKHEISVFWSLGGIAPLGLIGAQFNNTLGGLLCGVQLFCFLTAVYYGFIKK